MREASLAPFLRYSDLSGAEGPRGEFRVFGELEAIQGRDRIWINTGEFTVEADLEGVRLYLLPSLSAGGGLPEPLPDEEPAVAPWNRVFSLPSGMRLFVGGSLFLEEGRGVFRSSPRAPLLVVCLRRGAGEHPEARHLGRAQEERVLEPVHPAVAAHRLPLPGPAGLPVPALLPGGAARPRRC